MSDTPRTDAFVTAETGITFGSRVANFARQLERELAVCQANELDWAASSDGYAEHYREERSRRVQLQQAVQERDAELAELREDKARLDWLEEMKAGLNQAADPKRPHVWVNIDPEEPSKVEHFFEFTYRAAIDAARKATP